MANLSSASEAEAKNLSAIVGNAIESAVKQFGESELVGVLLRSPEVKGFLLNGQNYPAGADGLPERVKAYIGTVLDYVNLRRLLRLPYEQRVNAALDVMETAKNLVLEARPHLVGNIPNAAFMQASDALRNYGV